MAWHSRHDAPGVTGPRYCPGMLKTPGDTRSAKDFRALWNTKGGEDREREMKMEPNTQKIKVGDHVQVVRTVSDGGCFYDNFKGRVGQVFGVDLSEVRLRFSSGDIDTGHIADVEPVTPQRTITLNGVEYTLTPVAEAPAQGRRKPKKGEVWRDLDGGLHLVVYDWELEGKDALRPVDLTKGDICGVRSPKADLFRGGRFAFAYPTLAAAIADGALN